MAGTNDFLPFATSGGADVLTQAEYAALTTLLANGFTTGTALSAQLNKVWRQSSTMAHVLAQVIADLTNANVADDGNVAAIITNLKSILVSLNVANAWVKGQRGAPTALPVTTGNVTLDLSRANNWAAALTGNITLMNPSTMPVGQSGVITLTNGAASAYTIAYGAYWKPVDGVALAALTPVLSAVDDLVYYVESATRILVGRVGGSV